MPYNCPLGNPEEWDNIRALVKRCKAVDCSYLEDTDEELPIGCVLLVAALLESAKEKEASLNQKE